MDSSSPRAVKRCWMSFEKPFFDLREPLKYKNAFASVLKINFNFFLYTLSLR